MSLSIHHIGLAALMWPACGAQTIPYEYYATSNAFFKDPGYWSHGTLIGIEDSGTDAPLIYLMDEDENAERYRFRIPGARFVYLKAVARFEDRTIVTVGRAGYPEGKWDAFVAVVPPDRKSKTVISTWPWTPEAVALTPGGTIWTAALVAGRGEFRAFEPKGKLLRSFVVSLRPNTTASELRASADRIGWLTNQNEYFEFSFAGAIIDRFDGPPIARRGRPAFALGEANQLAMRGNPGELWMFDRAARTWVPVELLDARPWSHLLGIDDGFLLVGASDTIEWFERRAPGR